MLDKHSNFKLKKWYLDCVSENGEAFIAYCADLKWKSLGISYASYLAFDGRHSKTRTSLLQERLPVSSENSVLWESPKLSCAGNWRNRGAQLPKIQLLNDKDGSVVWNPRFPLADVQIDFGSQPWLTGLGYAECLELTIPPWKLPIEKLIWGRFVSQDMYIVWIEWRGPTPLTLVYMNGEKVEDASISDSGLSWSQGSLQHAQSSVLRKGDLVNTVLKAIPGAEEIFPRKIVNLYECKWLSRSNVTLNKTVYCGWTIHEIVRF